MVDFIKTELMTFLIMAVPILLFLACNVIALCSLKKKRFKPLWIITYILAWLVLLPMLVSTAFALIVRMTALGWIQSDLLPFLIELFTIVEPIGNFAILIINEITLEIMVYLLTALCVLTLVVMLIKWKEKQIYCDGEGYLTVGEESKASVEMPSVDNIVLTDGDEMVEIIPACEEIVEHESVDIPTQTEQEIQPIDDEIEEQTTDDEPIAEEEQTTDDEPIAEEPIETVFEEQPPIEETLVDEEIEQEQTVDETVEESVEETAEQEIEQEEIVEEVEQEENLAENEEVVIEKEEPIAQHKDFSSIVLTPRTVKKHTRRASSIEIIKPKTDDTVVAENEKQTHTKKRVVNKASDLFGEYLSQQGEQEKQRIKGLLDTINFKK